MGRRKKYNYNNPKSWGLYNRKSEEGISNIPYECFEQWYENKEKICDYCGITEEESALLYKHFPGATRGGRRGKSLELDRKDPFKDYGEGGIENFALACYWCNNAKSNYFTAEEFLDIAKAIVEKNRKRLSQIKLR